jgi:uncharacterized DUF497 family protein
MKSVTGRFNKKFQKRKPREKKKREPRTNTDGHGEKIEKKFIIWYNTTVKKFKWNEGKNIWLMETRGISFEEILEDIKNDQIIARTEHPDQIKYPRQKIFIINHNDYCYVVPFIEDKGDYFLKTIIPSRKATKKYLKDGGQHE